MACRLSSLSPVLGGVTACIAFYSISTVVIATSLPAWAAAAFASLAIGYATFLLAKKLLGRCNPIVVVEQNRGVIRVTAPDERVNKKRTVVVLYPTEYGYSASLKAVFLGQDPNLDIHESHYASDVSIKEIARRASAVILFREFSNPRKFIPEDPFDEDFMFWKKTNELPPHVVKHFILAFDKEENINMPQASSVLDKELQMHAYSNQDCRLPSKVARAIINTIHEPFYS